MRIAIDIRLLLYPTDAVYRHFIHEILTRLCAHRINDQFILLVNDDERYVQPAGFNVKQIPIEIVKPNQLLSAYRQKTKLQKLLKKETIDVLVTMDGTCYENLNTPQCIFLPYFPADKDTFMQDFILSNPKKKQLFTITKNAKSIATFSLFVKNELATQFAFPLNFIHLIKTQPFANPPLLTEINSREIKNKYSEGKEYFISMPASDSIDETIERLKAFSLFKKRQQSGMKLILIANDANQADILAKNIATYKFKNEVVLLNEPSPHTRAKIIGAAYAFLDISSGNMPPIAALQALTSGKPIIGNPSLEPITKTAGIYGSDITAIGSHLMMLYKNDTLYKTLNAEALLEAKNYQINDCVDACWLAIASAYNSVSGHPS